MPNQPAIFLMYHELGLVGRQLSQSAPRYKRYVIPLPQFEAQISNISKEGLRGVNVTEALQFSAGQVAITFDDGCETDLLAAAPVLARFGFGATFYVIAGFVGKQH